MGLGFNPSTYEKYLIVGIMIAGLVNGLLHIFLVPPWQHYDEPGHFEYAWLIANKPGLPEPGDYDQSIRREVAASMIEHDFFADNGFRPNLLSITKPVWIGISQTDDVPFYYMLVAIPFYIFRYSDITFQLYLGRLISLSLFLVTILGSYAITSEITKPGNALRLLVPATVALIPGFVDIMTAVNNDVGAASFFTLFLWICIRIMLRGITRWNFGVLVLLMILCIYTKSTTIFVVPLAIIAVVFSLLSPGKRFYLWLVAPLLGLVIFMILIRFNGAAFWQSQASVPSVRRVQSEIAPHGSYAISLDSPVDNIPSTANQLILVNDVQKLIGRTISMGAWIWATEPGQARTPIFDNGIDQEFKIVEVDVIPQFFVYTIKLVETDDQVLVRLRSIRQLEDKQVRIFYDGITLIEGDYTINGTPTFDDIHGLHGRWGDTNFSNLIRNASFERAAPLFNSKIEVLIDSYLPTRISSVISSIVDIEVYKNYYISSAQHLFRSFWAVFGWGQVYLVGSKPYRVLLVLSIIALIGDTIYVFRNRNKLDMHILAFLSLAFIGVWGMAITRGVGSVFSNLFIPAARYAYPVIVPTVMLFVVGWREILNILGERFHTPSIYLYSGYILFLIILNIVSYYSILRFYGTI